jgi:hypothetical protein
MSSYSQRRMAKRCESKHASMTSELTEEMWVAYEGCVAEARSEADTGSCECEWSDAHQCKDEATP